MSGTENDFLKDGKDVVLFVDEEETGPSASDGQNGAVRPDGTINWECPCIAPIMESPCAEEFKGAFSCFVHSEEEPKGGDCVELFGVFSGCVQDNQEYFDKVVKEGEDLMSGVSEAAAPAAATQEPESDSEAEDSQGELTDGFNSEADSSDSESSDSSDSESESEGEVVTAVHLTRLQPPRNTPTLVDSIRDVTDLVSAKVAAAEADLTTEATQLLSEVEHAADDALIAAAEVVEGTVAAVRKVEDTLANDTARAVAESKELVADATEVFVAAEKKVEETLSADTARMNAEVEEISSDVSEAVAAVEKKVVDTISADTARAVAETKELVADVSEVLAAAEKKVVDTISADTARAVSETKELVADATEVFVAVEKKIEATIGADAVRAIAETRELVSDATTAFSTLKGEKSITETVVTEVAVLATEAAVGKAFEKSEKKKE